MKQFHLRSSVIGCFALFSLMAGSLEAQTLYTTPYGQTTVWNEPEMWETSDPTHLYPHLDGHRAHVRGGDGQIGLNVNISNLTLESLEIWGGRNLQPSSVSTVSITLRADPDREGSVPAFYVGTNYSGAPTNADGDSLQGRQSPVNLKSGVQITLIGGTMNFGGAVGSNRAGQARVTLEAGSSLTAGTSSNRVEWTVARQVHSRSDNRESFLTGQAGSEFTGYFSSVKIGANDATSLYQGNLPTITGKVDLTQATVHAFDVGGQVSIGKGATPDLGGSYGELRLPELDAIVGGDLTIGDTMTQSSGLLELRQTHVEVGGDVVLNLTGKVSVTIGDTSAGLRLSENSNLSIVAIGGDGADPNAGYFMQFTGEGTPEGLIYGLAWEGGDHTVLLQGLIDDFAITWTSTLDTAPQLFFDQTLNTTFIGYAAIPEPGSLSLLVGGGLLLGTLAARKGRRNS